MIARGLDDDQRDPERGRQVPLGLLTDGSWIWDASVAYYLDVHGLPPEPQFPAYLRGRDFRCAEPTPEQVTAAQVAVRAE